MATPGGERVVPIRRTQSGWWVSRVHYSVVPGYDAEAIRSTMSEAEWRREGEIDWTSSSGSPIYPDWSPRYHLAVEPLVYDPSRPLYVGLDVGLCPAAVFVQLNSYGQLLILSELTWAEGSGVGTYEFGEAIADHLTEEYAIPTGQELERMRLSFAGDPAGNAPPVKVAANAMNRDVRSHFQILRDGLDIVIGHDDEDEPIYEHKPGWGWRILAGEIHIPKRIAVVTARLKLLVHGEPALVVDPRCTTLVKGFGGGYHYPMHSSGRYGYDPEKNVFSHVHDSLQYCVSRLYTLPDADEDEDAPRAEPFASMASGLRYHRG